MKNFKSAIQSFVLIFFAFSNPLYAATINIYQGNSFESAVENLNPGDTLIVHQGTYMDSGRISITVKGTPTSPVVIKGADGETPPLIARSGSAASQNTINIEGASYLTIKNLEITNIADEGISLGNDTSYITMEDLNIHDVDIGIGVHSGNANNIIVRRTHIHRTGKNGGTGEGMYLGCNNAGCILHDSIFENNWIHDSLPETSQGDGIELKPGSYNNIIRNNVIYNRNYPGIFVYGGGSGINTVEGNAVWNCPEAIYAVSDAIVRNNLVFNSDSGISSYSHVQVSGMKNLTIVNNTLYNNNDGLFLRWGTVSNMTLSNNAVYSPGKTAVNTNGGVNGAGILVRSNYIEGGADVTIDSLKFFSGGTSANAFADAPNSNLWPKPGSILIGKGEASLTPSKDFNDTPRTQPYDVGAYETDGLSSNPGWTVGPGFKTAGSPPDTLAPKAPTGILVQ